MTSQQQAGIGADPDRTKPADGTDGGQLSSRRHSCVCSPLLVSALPMLGFPPAVVAGVYSSINGCKQSCFMHSWQTGMVSTGEIDARNRTRRNQRNEPNGGLGKLNRFCGLSWCGLSANAKRRNEPIVRLDKIYRLWRRPMERPSPQGKRRNEPSVNLGLLYGVSGISGLLGVRTLCCLGDGVRVSGRALACGAMHPESVRGCFSGSRTVERSIEPKPGGARSGLGERCGTNPTGQSLHVKSGRASGYAAIPLDGPGVWSPPPMVGGTDGGRRYGQDGGGLVARPGDRERLATGWAAVVPSANPRPGPVGGRSLLLQDDAGPLSEPAPAADRAGVSGPVRSGYRPALGGPGSLAAPPGPVRSPWERGRGRRPAAVRPPRPAAGRRRAPKTGPEAPRGADFRPDSPRHPLLSIAGPVRRLLVCQSAFPIRERCRDSSGIE